MLTFAIPTWNRVDKLRVCLDSMIQQINEVDDEVKICVYNNASTDGTDLLLAEYGIDHINGKDHVRGTESFKRAFMMPKTDWMWMFGDDDILAQNGLKTVLDIIKRKDVEFIHGAEETRVTGERRTYYASTLDLCSGFGFTEMTGFISGNICKTKKLQEVLSGPNCETYQECSYFQSLAIMEAFSTSKAAFINTPIIDLQDRQQTAETCARWELDSASMHYTDIGTGLKVLKEIGKIPAELPDDFFRYLSANLFTKIMFNFYAEASGKIKKIEDKYWVMLNNMASFLRDGERERMYNVISNFKEELDKFVEHEQQKEKLVENVKIAHDKSLSIIYPETYV